MKFLVIVVLGSMLTGGPPVIWKSKSVRYMKKYMITLALLTLGMSANAQWISGLDEIEMQGHWVVTSVNGGFPEFNSDYHPQYPTAIDFNNRNYTYVWFTDYNGNETSERFAGYFVGGTATGRYTLHLLSRKEYNSDYTGLSFANFWIKQFDSQNMTISDYDGNSYIKLQKVDAASVRSVATDTTANSKAYGLNGVELPTPETAKGIVIQNGKKTVRK